MLSTYGAGYDVCDLEAATAAGVAVVQATRALSGRVVDIPGYRPDGIVVSDNLSMQKARILLMVALAHGVKGRDALTEAFRTY